MRKTSTNLETNSSDDDEVEDQVFFITDERQEDEDEYLDTRSSDIENLFNTLINLKKAYSYTQMTNRVGKDFLLNYLFAKYRFNDVKLVKGKFLCDSNVGNLAIKCRKYDKAIIHLMEAVRDPQNNIVKLETKSIKGAKFRQTKKTYIKKSKKNTRVSSNINDNSEWEKDNKKVEALKKKFLDSRYPKLLYAFKKFYKILNRLAKNKNAFNDVTREDIFALYDRHSLEKYEKIIQEYRLMAYHYGDVKKHAEAILELNEFQINYRLKTFIIQPDDEMRKRQRRHNTRDNSKLPRFRPNPLRPPRNS